MDKRVDFDKSRECHVFCQLRKKKYRNVNKIK